MKRLAIIICSVVIFLTGSFVVYNTYVRNKHCTEASYSKEDCKQKSSGSYSLKMSLVCEHSCAAKEYDPAKVVSESRAEEGDLTKCPVSGVIFKVTNESSQVNYNGKTIYTCCGTCATMFEETPEKYASNIN